MTEGGIASWKVKEGDSFAPGDVLLEIVRLSSSTRSRPPSPGQRADISYARPQETDKATMDVEAQDEGVLGKILVRCRSLPSSPLVRSTSS